jgi:hypothetical protein
LGNLASAASVYFRTTPLKTFASSVSFPDRSKFGFSFGLITFVSSSVVSLLSEFRGDLDGELGFSYIRGDLGGELGFSYLRGDLDLERCLYYLLIQ